MNMGELEFNQLSKQVDDEDCFGFHSEYYIGPDWRKEGNNIKPAVASIVLRYPGRGYAEYSKYLDDIYFIPLNFYDSKNNAVYIIKSNVKQKTSCAIKLDIKESFDYKPCIAVNRWGYFLYDMKMITLFGFDGREIYTHKFGQKNYVECIYIYDNKVIYSETRQVAISTQIYCVNMLTKEKWLMWGTQKGDSVFDSYLRESYRQRWGSDLPFSQAPSNIGDISCHFLYANKRRVIAGFSRCSGHGISYIIQVDLATNKWSILDCFSWPYWKENKDLFPSEDDGRIFSFNMLDDTMWVKAPGTDIDLIHTDIQRMAQLHGKYPVDWTFYEKPMAGIADFYYFDGRIACLPENNELDRIERNGERKKIEFHHYQTREFWCFDGIYLIPDVYRPYCFRNITDGTAVYMPGGEHGNIEELIKSANSPQSEATEAKKTAPQAVPFQKEKTVRGIEDNDQLSLAAFRSDAPSMTGFREKLLAYRKSLPDSWDYNAFVGILLGVGGPKHGDAACMNFAIGQGDNGNNTKKTLAAKGLMSVFEKYKGKKIDEAILLSDVEDEIIAIAPEYASIRQKLHDILCHL